VSQKIDIDEIAAPLPLRLHQVADRHIARSPNHVAVIDETGSWTYRELDFHVGRIAEELSALGIRAGDRMMIVSEDSIALECSGRCMTGSHCCGFSAMASRPRPARLPNWMR
jgi:long-chain acyl-CoA synthetase